jgi:2-methylaconitate cis-trans-isomerase PrpF
MLEYAEALIVAVVNVGRLVDTTADIVNRKHLKAGQVLLEGCPIDASPLKLYAFDYTSMLRRESVDDWQKLSILAYTQQLVDDKDLQH